MAHGVVTSSQPLMLVLNATELTAPMSAHPRSSLALLSVASGDHAQLYRIPIRQEHAADNSAIYGINYNESVHSAVVVYS